MRRLNGVAVAWLLAVVMALMLPGRADAIPLNLNIDERIFQSGNGLDSTKLSGTATVDLIGTNTLRFVLTNTSTDAGGLLGQNILTGLGFNLPTGLSVASLSAVSIDTGGSHSVALAGLSVVSPTTAGAIDNTKWGYGTVGVSQGDGFKTVANNGAVVGGSVNFDIGTVQSMIERNLNNLATGGPSGADVQGPNWGLLSNTSGFTACNSGLPCIKNSLTFDIQVTDTPNALLPAFINDNYVVLAFGSPNVSAAAAVPEPGTLLLLGTGLIGAGLGWRRRLRSCNEP